MSHSLEKDFGCIRTFLWPVHRHECRKLVPLLMMIFLVGFNYSILRCMKDAVVVTASGAEVLPFIKLWVMLPMAVLGTYIFAKLSNHFSQERVVYIVITAFLFLFGLFAFVVYPLRDVIHPYESAAYLDMLLPEGLRGLVSMYRNWTFTAFYVISELWGTIVFNVIFWGVANEVTRISEARRFYGVLGVSSNIAAIFAGQAANYFSQGTVFNPNLPFGKTPWEQTMMLLVLVIATSGVITMAIFRWLNKNVLNDNEFDEFHHKGKPIQLKKKKKLSLKDSFSFLSNSRYLFFIAVLVVAYNLTINLVEVVWKDHLRILYPSPSEYSTFMNNLTSITGIISTVMAFFIAIIIDRFGWTWTALITPVMMIITGCGFFGFIIFGDAFSGIIAFLGTTPLMLAVYCGAAQNCFSKAMKYSVFDATKEMTFIPLDHDYKLKGKAAIDGVGSRLGKSGGSFIHTGLLLFRGSLTSSVSIVAAILMLVVSFWIHSVYKLGKLFNAKVKSQGEEAIDVEEPEQVATAT